MRAEAPAAVSGTPPSGAPTYGLASSLADGREIFYYNDDRSHRPVPPDTRELPAPAEGSELRYDPLLDEWVVVASHRQERTHLPSSVDCPLCPSSPGHRTEVPAADYDVVVFENRFPSLMHGGDAVEPLVEPYDARPGAGRCEVISFTLDHVGSVARLPTRRVRTIIDAWADRTAALSGHADVEEVFCFENRGVEIGVTLHHPHGQIYGYPFRTPTSRRMLSSASRHLAETGRNLFADVLESERTVGTRVIARTSRWTAFVPAAARWPFEIHLYPHRQVPDLPALDEQERAELAEIYPLVLRRLDAVFGVPMPYIAAWHQAPVRVDRDLAYLHLRIHSIRRAPDRLKFPAASEAAMGVFINDVRPEHAAALLRGEPT